VRTKALATIEAKFWMPAEKQYAFAMLEDGTVNANVTAWAATAMAFGVVDRERGADMAAKLAASGVSTDWGARPLSAASTLFDPLHYNNGAVWPFVTGFVSLAEYQYHNAGAGLLALRAIARTGFDHSLGRNPEVISGRLYKPLDTAVPQQFFATSMVLTPLIRGLLGIDVDAPRRRVVIAPHLPADWDSVRVRNVPVGAGRLSFAVHRSAGAITLDVTREGGDRAPLDVEFAPALPLGATGTDGTTITHTPGDEHGQVRRSVSDSAQLVVRYAGGWSITAPVAAVPVGSRSTAPRILSERMDASGERSYDVALEGLAGRAYTFRVRAPTANGARALRARAGGGASATPGADVSNGTSRPVTVIFPVAGANADGYTATTVSFSIGVP
jgi:hypothetical protein